jgi:hypothetical protein
MLCRRARPWAIVCGLLCVLDVALGCSSKGPQYPEDHARFRRIDAAVESLRQAYVERNLSKIEALLLPVDSLEPVTAEVRKDFEQFQEINLDFAIDRIVIEGDLIDVFVHWQGQWKRTPTDSGVRDRGHGLLRWIGVHSILLQSTEGDLPFGMATRHATPQASAAIS